jgi:acetyl esterase/lipase
MSRRLACLSPVGLINALTVRSRFAVVRDQRYAPGDRGGLDVYVPRNASRPSPVVFFIYGGGWTEGERGMYLFVGGALASRGFVTVIADYRLFPEVRFPGFLQDNAAALRWTVDNASRYGGDARRLVLMGHSAGAYNAAMLALDPAWLGAVGLDPARALRGVAGLAGPYDFLPLTSPTLQTIFAPPDELARTQPINFVSAAAPPLWLAAGAGDQTVDPGNTVRLAAHALAAGAQARSTIYRGIDHITLIGAFAQPLRFLAPVLADVTGFFEARTGIA